MTDFERLLGALDRSGVRFVIVGGLAATVHGSSRLTQDIDIVYDRSSDNLEHLVAALEPHEPYLRGAPPDLPFDWSAATLGHGLRLARNTCGPWWSRTPNEKS